MNTKNILILTVTLALLGAGPVVQKGREPAPRPVDHRNSAPVRPRTWTSRPSRAWSWPGRTTPRSGSTKRMRVGSWPKPGQRTGQRGQHRAPPGNHPRPARRTAHQRSDRAAGFSTRRGPGRALTLRQGRSRPPPVSGQVGFRTVFVREADTNAVHIVPGTPGPGRTQGPHALCPVLDRHQPAVGHGVRGARIAPDHA